MMTSSPPGSFVAIESPGAATTHLANQPRIWSKSFPAAAASLLYHWEPKTQGRVRPHHRIARPPGPSDCEDYVFAAVTAVITQPTSLTRNGPTLPSFRNSSQAQADHMDVKLRRPL
jgi:hypothetical protein